MSEEKPHNHYRGRLAPPPSGFLHLVMFEHLAAWERARAVNGQLVFGWMIWTPRCTEEYSNACWMISKEWDWTGTKDQTRRALGPYEQSSVRDLFGYVLKLYKLGCIYPCNKSRKDVEMQE